MPREKIVYICDMCNTEYATKDQAIECETLRHTTILKVRPHYTSTDRRPATLDVTLSTGECVKYVRSDLCDYD